MALIPVSLVRNISGNSAPAVYRQSQGTDYFLNAVGEAIVVVKNGGAVAATVTVPKTSKAAGADIVLTVPAGQERVVWGLVPELYNDTASDGSITPLKDSKHCTDWARVVCSPSAGVSVAVFWAGVVKRL